VSKIANASSASEEPVSAVGADSAYADLALSVTGLSKVYPGTRALGGVDLTVRKGEVQALCGGNGCGKSTLIKILSGVVAGDTGTVRIRDHQLDVSDIRPQRVHELGLRVVHQDLAVFPDMSVAENLALGGDFPTRATGNVDWMTLKRRASELIAEFEIDASPSDLLRQLPLAARAQVAIARALKDVKSGTGIVILDEPTASLPAHEAKVLHAAIRRLAQAGHAVLFVSHRLDEVMALTDRVTVLRDGHLVATHNTAELTEQELIESILGHRAAELRPHKALSENSPVILDVSSVSAGPLQDVDLTVRAGEVVGIAGLLGSGRTELLRAIYGDLRVESGTITVNGVRANFSRKDQAVARGVVLIPEDRTAGGVFPSLSVDENMDVSVLRRYWRLIFQKRRLRADDGILRRSLNVKASSGRTGMTSLSGGNQQKAVLARWLRRDPVLLLLDEPTQGVDVGARADIYAAVREVTEAGGAAVVVASDLEELAQVVDRAIVLRSGVVTAEVGYSELSAQHLNELIYAGGDRAVL
jgi:ribose transport system ATP-binding protein